MAAKRDRPFAQFNFLVDLGTGNSDGPEAGFQECSNIGMEVAVAEYLDGGRPAGSRAGAVVSGAVSGLHRGAV